MSEGGWGDLLPHLENGGENGSAENAWSDKRGRRGYCICCEERKQNCHRHHISYEPERTRTVCAECHYRIHHESGYYDDLEPDFMRRRRERKERREEDDNFSVSAGSDPGNGRYKLVELPSDYLNGSKPSLLGSFDNRGDAESEIQKKIYGLDLHGSDFEIMMPGESVEVEAKILGCEREMYLIICSECHSLHMSDNESSELCLDCNNQV